MQPTNARRGSEYRAFGDGPGPIVIGRRGRFADMESATQEPSNSSSPLYRCSVPLHEDAPAYPRLLSVLQQARRARGRAGEEPPAVRAPGGPAAVPTGDGRVRRLPSPEARGTREADEEDPAPLPLPGMP